LKGFSKRVDASSSKLFTTLMQEYSGGRAGKERQDINGAKHWKLRKRRKKYLIEN
jgi:hypothetical protein